MFAPTALVVQLVAIVALTSARPEFQPKKHAQDDDRYMHPHISKRHLGRREIDPKRRDGEETAEFWRQNAQLTINERLNRKANTGVAKNVIMFLGDGMSITTLAASRIYMSQLNHVGGEESQLSFEKFPFTGLSKTYCVDHQTADSACSATAYLCGVKANSGTIGVTAQVPRKDCSASLNATTHVTSIARWSQLKDKRTGIVTTTRITHASPTGTYANVADRDWECDTDVKNAHQDPEECPDIAHQLVFGDTGKNFNVILGGGRKNFLPKDAQDEEGRPGDRSDGVNLIDEWKKQKQNETSAYVWNRDQLQALSNDEDFVLGLFDHDHVPFFLDAAKNKPTLAEMTESAIKHLKKGPNGYFLFVEGGRIDHAHHESLAKQALSETVQFSEAIQRAVDLTDEEDTLIVVTSDHAHTMSMAGYAPRGGDILGVAGKADDGLPYLTLTYANGPGYRPVDDNGKRPDYSKDDLDDKDYRRPSTAPIDTETHGGEDVGIFARGPWAHLLVGSTEQNVIPHVMAYASCVGDGITVCDEPLKY